MAIIRVLTPLLQPAQSVVCCGSHPLLGNWNPAAAPQMKRSGIPLWTLDLPDSLPADTEFKFVIVCGDEHQWEEGPNRRINAPGPLDFRGKEPWRAAGVAVPVFSLRSEADCGCGDFEDLKLLVDWAAATGQQIIQILPVNDTTMTRSSSDSYPYSAISSFALHPLYLRPQLLGELPDPEARICFEQERLRLNAADSVDYPAVIALKEAYARVIYNESGRKETASRPFADFVAENAEWLLPYCAYSVLRDAGRREPYSPGLVAELALQNTDGNFLFYAWLQYHLHLQLLDACRYARSRGVAVKGDIPIGVSPDSVDAWQYPELFNLDSSAGAPPDAFAADGQNWGFPTYNWQRMASDGFKWWRRRLGAMARYFDAYRIDHILGFFRIWEIPAGVSSGLLGHFSPALPMAPAEMQSAFEFEFNPTMAQASPESPTDLLFIEDPRSPGLYHPRIMGYDTEAFQRLDPAQQQAYRAIHEHFFYHRHNDFWRQSALLKLPALVNATPMLACAEDLGMIPACVPGVLDSERILALEVQRMPKQFGVSLADPLAYSRMNVATTSTHDMPPLRLWLENEGLDSSPRACESFLETHAKSPAMLAIFPIQDWLAASGELRRAQAAEEQINIPADPNHYWRYRLHIPLEKMLNSTDFRAKLLKLRG
ncbi:MAG: 4-alpha-glucanotransferase [Muribaculaceae bacterium]|nr:4-alpha-glucanotransferase [Muribaculaceae bacterium]